MTADESSSPGVSAIAASWVAKNDRGLLQEERRELERWLATDVENRREFDRLLQAWIRAGKFQNDPRAVAITDAILARRTRRWYQTFPGQCALGSAIAASLLAAFLAIRPRTQIMPQAPIGIRIVPAEAKSLTLSDGSCVDLNGASEINERFDKSERDVQLLHGEAHFKVAKNASWPFRVDAGIVTVRAVGTAFDVRESEGLVEVLVTEGKIRLEGIRGASEETYVVAGQRATIAVTGGSTSAIQLETVSLSQQEAELSWRAPRLQFSNTPLDQVILAFNRFNERKLALGDASLGAKTLSGTFDTHNVDGFLHLLTESMGLRVRQDPDGVAVLMLAN